MPTQNACPSSAHTPVYVPFIILTIIRYNGPDICLKLILIICESLKIGLLIFRIKKGGYTGIFYKQPAQHEARKAG